MRQASVVAFVLLDAHKVAEDIEDNNEVVVLWNKYREMGKARELVFKRKAVKWLKQKVKVHKKGQEENGEELVELMNEKNRNGVDLGTMEKEGGFKSGHGIPETEMDMNIITDNVKL